MARKLTSVSRFFQNCAGKNNSSMREAVRRGALIVLEGCDRSGKTTQCQRLVTALNDQGITSQLMRFPERSTTIGTMISNYLERKCEMEDHAIHLLFAANRWELVPKMKELLQSGTTVIVDRYSFSGVAFSAAKPGVDMTWCRGAEVGLPEPDAVFYLTLSAEEAAKRAAFGGERYEETEFQRRVAKNYKLLMDQSWKELDASQSIDLLHEDIVKLAVGVVNDSSQLPMRGLWQASETADLPQQSPVKRPRGQLDSTDTAVHQEDS